MAVPTTTNTRMPSDVSPLVKILDHPVHQENVKLTEEERRILYLWLDGNASFYGCYSQSEQLAQREGKAIPPPTLQ